MTMPAEIRFAMLAEQTNRQFAHAVVYGGLTREEARDFSVWVLREGLNKIGPAENLALFLDVTGRAG